VPVHAFWDGAWGVHAGCVNAGVGEANVFGWGKPLMNADRILTQRGRRCIRGSPGRGTVSTHG